MRLVSWNSVFSDHGHVRAALKDSIWFKLEQRFSRRLTPDNLSHCIPVL